jgi:hypothetical protein
MSLSMGNHGGIGIFEACASSGQIVILLLIGHRIHSLSSAQFITDKIMTFLVEPFENGMY